MKFKSRKWTKSISVEKASHYVVTSVGALWGSLVQFSSSTLVLQTVWRCFGKRSKRATVVIYLDVYFVNSQATNTPLASHFIDPRLHLSLVFVVVVHVSLINPIYLNFWNGASAQLLLLHLCAKISESSVSQPASRAALQRISVSTRVFGYIKQNPETFSVSIIQSPHFPAPWASSIPNGSQITAENCFLFVIIDGHIGHCYNSWNLYKTIWICSGVNIVGPEEQNKIGGCKISTSPSFIILFSFSRFMFGDDV